uniref:F-box domain-containing protein n=1 Tax=Fagus sylvatica TaxID=28930 RepID=A0A2N9F859_FAGSY
MAERRKLSRQKDSVLDRISNLPESLLCHILSFLPTKNAVATSILSSRWKLLWTLVPKLDLDTDTIDSYKGNWKLHWTVVPGLDKAIFFEHIVFRVLELQQQTQCLQKFRLKFEVGDSTSYGQYLETWLRVAAARKVKELNLEICFDRATMVWKPLKLRDSVYTCRTLVVLKLRGETEINTPSLSFQFPCLKILHLISVFHSREHSLSRLLSSCPVLEELSYERKYEEIEYRKISVPTVKRLSITLREDRYFCNHKLEINAPALEYFNFKGDLLDIKINEKLDNLVEANVDIWTFCSKRWEDDRHEERCRDRVFQLLAALSNVKLLSFYFREIQLLHIGFVYPASYQNLVRLDFKVSVACNWLVLLDLLQNAPNLEFLVVSKSDDFLEHSLCWKEPPDYLSSHLKSLCYRGFEGLRSEVGFLKYIVKYARVLKTVTIQFSGGELKEIVL